MVRTKTGTLRGLDTHRLTVATSQEISKRYRTKVREDLDHGWVWECNTFWIYPLLARLTHLDAIFRFIFPLAYVIFTLVALSEVDFGIAQYHKLSSSRCYNSTTAAAGWFDADAH